jgi:O-antigen/teichoic acid export membrane protein
MRDVAHSPEDVRERVNQILGLRLALGSLSFVLFVSMVVVLPKPAEFKHFLLLYGFLIFTSSSLLDWAFQGLERMELVALGEVLRAGSYLALVVVGLHNRSQIFRIPIFTLLSQLLPVGLLFGVFWRKYQVIRPTVDWVAWKDSLRQALPISIGSLALQFGSGLDVVLLGLLGRESEVGYYRAASQLVAVPGNFTVLFGFVMLPVMARYWKHQPEKLTALTRFTGRLLIMAVLPIVVGGSMFASSALPLVFGHGFQGSVPVFRILLGYFLVAHLYCPFFYLLLACGKQKQFMKCFLAGAVVALVGNLMLIPLYGTRGAALATVAWHSTILIGQYRACRSIVSLSVGRDLLRMIPPAALMALIMWVTPAGWLVKLAVGAGAYVGLIAIWERKTCMQVVRSLHLATI